MGAGTMVTFSNRLDGTIQQNLEERRNRPLDESRARSAQTRQDFNHVLEDKNADVDSDHRAERVPEDLAGRVCYELEPLVTP
ncbi:hypothetical protein WMY93_015469 [Mugilogobius chulae]|uniref:Uncharacterized protein n=1 Tax=Mugilogobius chulae TaxID=88201 RepID=A0AAW0NRB7_9GOBI